MKDEKVKTQLNIEIPADLEEVYSNLAVIAHSSSEFVFDFIRVMPNMPKSKVKSIVVMFPKVSIVSLPSHLLDQLLLTQYVAPY